MKSIYIHIPFCKTICTYCDFCKMYYKKEWVNNYLKELDKEFDKYYQKELISTIYIGGGTPSSLNKYELDILFSTIKKIKLNKEYEFTFECNIEDINEDLLIYLKNHKVNRLSIGVESLSNKILKTLGRPSQNINNILLAKQYFNNINIDLIYGISNQTIKDLDKDLKSFIELNISHISIYSLIFEDNTILKTNNYKEIDPDLSRDMYERICKILKNNNYIHYEISNFSKKGYESLHNLTYWNNEHYYGFGLGASGYINNLRYTNTRSLTNYLKGNYRYEEDLLTKTITMENEMILGLRKIQGVSKKDFYKKYNKHIKDVFNTSKLDENKDYFYINENNLYISNTILQDFINI
jgi:putative oxygen-independent coproporphyrinogen III oxidase